MASSSSSAASSPNQYDVFINHRGPDVKKTFASYLYRRLLIHGLRVFLDQQELQEGDDLAPQIECAIKTASVQVAIFSPAYAQSSWCLNELHLMLETLERGATILPVFYNVQPSQLRWNRGDNGPYADALRNLEKKKTHEDKLRYDPATLEKWRNDLSRVADKSGFELAKYNGDEGELLDEVVQRVLEKVKKPGLEVAKYPTGLDDKIQDFENIVLMKQSQIFGIVGLGGVGKTTLAKEFFNRKSSDYNGSCCFLSDVRESATKGSLHLLQRELMKRLAGYDTQINSVDEGTGMLRIRLSSSKALVILDDVDDVKQVDALFPVGTLLKPDSLILITSRNRDVLRRSRVEESSIYNLSGLNLWQSRELFCFHSFSQADPVPGFEDLVNKFIKACDGLPLSLTVFGALVHGNNEPSYWEDQLDRLQRILPTEIKQVLKISYDALEVEEQYIFLDIACFFIGQKRDTAIKIWEGSGWNGRLGFRNIEDRCLVKVDRKNLIHMHDHLRDLGRDMAEAPRLPLRLWHGMKNILQQLSVIKEVRGIRMIGENIDSDDSFHGIRMGNLQLLDAEDGLLESLFQTVNCRNLVWLRWKGCPYSSLPSWILTKNLRVLQMESNQLKTLWQKESQAPLQLRELEISSPLSNIPKSIGQLKHLERIVVSGGRQVIFPEEFCDLQSLKLLELVDCTKMKLLPDRFGNLINLQHIELRKCPNLRRLPDSFGNLTHLKYLSLVECNNLAISSNTFGNIRTLEHIVLEGCNKLKVLPPQVAQQKSLQRLILKLLHLEELPSAIGELSDLEVLGLQCNSLEELPPSLGDLRNLKNLFLVDCKNLKCLPSSARLLTQLTLLRVWRCCGISKLPFEMVEGKRETLGSSSNSESSIQQCMPRLQSLSARVCPNLQELQLLNFDGAVEIGTLPNTLVRLYLLGCRHLRKIEGLCGLANLQTLLVNSCNEVEELPSVETLISLEQFRLSSCWKLKTIRGLGVLTKLKSVDVAMCPRLEELPGIEDVRSLVYLNVSDCPKLQWTGGVVEQLQQRLKTFKC